MYLSSYNYVLVKLSWTEIKLKICQKLLAYLYFNLKLLKTSIQYNYVDMFQKPFTNQNYDILKKNISPLVIKNLFSFSVEFSGNFIMNLAWPGMWTHIIFLRIRIQGHISVIFGQFFL